ncbi:MAG: ROK family protein, partial [Nanoarchaeota archaeon]
MVLLTAIGVDFGGTNIRAALVSDTGKILREYSVKTPQKKAEIFNRLVDVISEVIEGTPVGLGIGIAGPFNRATGRIYPPNIKALYGLNIIKEMKKYIKTPFFIENDTNCFLVAEHKLGAAKKLKNVIGVTVGTGIGGAIIIDGKLYSGINGSAGEFGHMVIEPSVDDVGRGVRGSLENLASGTAMLREAKMHMTDVFTGKDLFALENKHKTAKKIISDSSRYLGLGLASLINIFTPEMIVLGGSVGVNYATSKTMRKEIGHEIKTRAIASTRIATQKVE